MKITIDDIKAQFASTNSINLRFKQVQDELNEKVLYRAPGDEPNSMKADIDMAGNDILNVFHIDVEELLVGGLPVGGDHLWGNITGNLAEQADLKAVLDGLASDITSNDGDILALQTDVAENATDIQNNTDAIVALNNSNNNKINGVDVSTDNDTAQSLEIDNSVSTLPEIRLTAQVGTKSPNTLVKLNASGLIPSEQLPFGGAYTPIGVFTVAADPGPYDNPSIRNPGTDYTNGEFFSIALPGVQTEGTVVAVNPDTGLEEDIIVSSGDALLFAEGNVTAPDGWYAVSRGGAGAVLASDVQYDPLGNAVIAPTSTNVDLALTDLDTASATNKTDIGTKEPDLGLPALTGQILTSDAAGIRSWIENTGATVAPTVIGTVAMWSSATPPEGWLECNGLVLDSVATPAYADLVELLNPGQTTATLPDMRGEFARGWDNGKGVDAGRTLLTAQAEEFKSHSHLVVSLSVRDQAAAAGSPLVNITNDAGILGSNSGDVPDSATHCPTATTGGTETRPRNTALMYIIKAFNVATEPQPPEYQINNYLTNKNYIINPTIGLINQRGYAGEVATQDGYSFDRWLLINGLSMTLPDVDGFITLGSDNTLPTTVQRIGDFSYKGEVTLSWEGTAKAGEFRDAGDVWDISHTSPWTFDLKDGTLTEYKLAVGFSDGTLKNVKLEVGSVATPFEYPDIATELAKCQRYYWRGGVAGADRYNYGTAALTLMTVAEFSFHTSMRITPVMNFVTAPLAENCSSVALITLGNDGFAIDATVTDTGKFRAYSGVYEADAEL